MCGRYTLTASAETLQLHFHLEDLPPNYAPRYNIAPTQPVSIITSDLPGTFTWVQWGLIPSWSKDPAIAHKLINARAETVDEKPSFRSAFKYRRCLIPADGFYEWKKDGKLKRPHYIFLKDRQVFAFAGLWERWNSPTGDEVLTCTILTTEPNETIKPLHHRMAVILEPEQYGDWLNTDTPAPVLKSMLASSPDGRLDLYEVSSAVNSPLSDHPDLIQPMQPPAQQNLF